MMTPDELVVDVQNLTVKFGSFCAVNEVSFSVGRGEIFGFLGANGAGKTTTIRVLCGLLYPGSGAVKVAGVEFKNRKDEETIKRRVGYMSQRSTLYDDLTVEENLAFFASLRRLDAKTYLTRRTKILDFIEFARPLNSLVKDLPGGIRQQVSLAASLLHDPEIIFLDEPTAGVTPAMRARFWELIKTLAGQEKTIFVTTHYMDEAEQCERIALMRSGKIVALDTPNNLKKIAFPDHLYECVPKAETTYAAIHQLKNRQELLYVEPFGARLHVAFQQAATEEFKHQLEHDFIVTAITPTLEDVFIKLTEEKTP